MSGTGPTILVLQMAKVASVSWYEAIEAAAAGREVNHIHFASVPARNFVAGICNAAGPEQTIAHRNMFRRLGLPRGTLADRLEGGTWKGGPVRIVSGIREPMSRALSVLQHGADFLGYTRLGLTPRDNGTPENLVQVFRNGWEHALSGRYPEDTFMRFLAYSIGHYRHWFAEELGGVFGLDAMAGEFDRQSWTMRIEQGPHAALIYRVEDLADPERRARLLAVASDFLGLRLAELPTANTAEGRRSRDLYRSFRAHAALPRDTVELIYDAPILQRFYTPAEMEGFRERWTETGR